MYSVPAGEYKKHLRQNTYNISSEINHFLEINILSHTQLGSMWRGVVGQFKQIAWHEKKRKELQKLKKMWQNITPENLKEICLSWRDISSFKTNLKVNLCQKLILMCIFILCAVDSIDSYKEIMVYILVIRAKSQISNISFEKRLIDWNLI